MKYFFIKSLFNKVNLKPKIFFIDDGVISEFNEKFYLEKNQDVKRSNMSATKHFLNFGIKEARVFREKKSHLKNIDPLSLSRGIKYGPKIGVLTENFENSIPVPCSMIRLINPLRELQYLKELMFESFNLSNISEYDFIIINRSALKTESYALEILHNLNPKSKIIYDIDDYLWGDFPEKNTALRVQVELGLLVADIVLVSTATMQKKIQQDFGVSASVIGNSSHFVKYDSSSSMGANKIIYFGTRTHQNDWKLIERALYQIHQMFPNLEICILGGVENEYDLPSFVKVIGDAGLYHYDKFVEKFASIDSVLIGLAPLCNDEFNQYKSAIKFFDYQMICKYVVASDVGEYKELDDPRLIKVAGNSQDEWVCAIKNAINLAMDDKSKNCNQSGKLEHLNLFRKMINPNKSQQGFVRKGFAGLSTYSVRSMIFEKYFQGTGVEIGALHNPLRVSNKVRVKYVDRLNKSDLYAHYPELKDFNLVDVDIVDDGEKLTTLADSSLDFIIANHMIEHCRNPIGTLINFQKKLKPSGLIYLAIPDCRFTFDIGRPHTDLDHLLADFKDDGISSERSHYDEWVRICEKNIGYKHESEDAIQMRIQDLMDMQYSIHYHVWTSEEFVTQVKDLTERGIVNLKIIDAVSVGEEMIIVLQKGE